MEAMKNIALYFTIYMYNAHLYVMHTQILSPLFGKNKDILMDNMNIFLLSS